MRIQRAYAIVTLGLGALGLAGLLALPASVPLGVVGIVERMAAYPLTLWIIFSAMMILTRLPSTSAHAPSKVTRSSS
jgi:hypothetical protein